MSPACAVAQQLPMYKVIVNEVICGICAYAQVFQCSKKIHVSSENFAS